MLMTITRFTKIDGDRCMVGEKATRAREGARNLRNIVGGISVSLGRVDDAIHA